MSRARGADRRAELRRVSGPVHRIANSRGSWSRREGLLLRVEEDGRVGFGEASPLPGYSTDTMVQAEADVRRWIGDGCKEPAAALRSPSARFAIEVALLDLRGRRENRPLWRFLGGVESPRPVSVQGLIPPSDPEETLATTVQWFERGLCTFKLKVGPDPEAERRRLEILRREFADRIQLRLDANRSLTGMRAEECLAAWSTFGVEWIEEPCETPGPIDSPIPLAFDESLREPEMAADGWRALGSWVRRAPYVALVLKPTVLGLDASLMLARLAREAGLEVVVSHTFEGPVAFQACAHLALAAGTSRACGLCRHSGLDAWPRVNGLLVGEVAVDPQRRAGAGLGLDGEAIWRMAGSR
ncbi:MAG: hypothetical protein MPN21_22750 [Thermoanaerobaculia bacterium]|nr:hypothetical protein [Thermoanaerobaculia bacterium]